MRFFEVNFDGLVGPTHNYAGLSFGNVASELNAQSVSHPKEAALQGLAKMKVLMSLGIPQAVIPPQVRPNLRLLRSLGFRGKDIEILHKVVCEEPQIFTAAFSSSSMWTANMALISPSPDTGDHRLHITPANLATNFHRSSEVHFSSKILRKIFRDANFFKVHKPLPSVPQLADEGAANHNRFCASYSDSGVELFVYGRRGFELLTDHNPTKYPARQTLEAELAIARRHRLSPENVIFAKQNPKAIDLGVFHNDVISVGNETVFLYHEESFENTNQVIQALQRKMYQEFYPIEVREAEFSIEDAVRTYLFNSQIVTIPDGSMVIIAPEECRSDARAMDVISRILSENNPVQECIFVNCRQSMQNGGGPACLRLRVVMDEEQRSACLASVFLNEILYERLVRWVKKHYRDKLAPSDLLDPDLLQESRAALSELAEILELGDLYDSFM